MNVVKRIDHNVQTYVQDLIDGGRRYVLQPAIECRQAVMTECERHELAGHILMEKFNNGDDVSTIFSEIIEESDLALIYICAQFCITNSQHNSGKLQDEVLASVTRYFYSDMQALLDAAWSEHANDKMGLVSSIDQVTGETLWSRR